VKAEIVFPYITGAILILAALAVYYAYRKTGSKPLLYLSIGLIFVGIESLLDGYEASLLARYAGGDWNRLPQQYLGEMLALDVIRGIFIILWAAMELVFVAALAGSENKTVTIGLPAAIVVLGIIETVGLDYSHIQPLEHRIFVSSAVRVLVFLVPTAIAAGLYILAKLYRDVGSTSLLLFGLGFLIHGFTLPFYSIAKEKGPVTLGLWYALGGIIPSLLAAAGAFALEREMGVEE